VFICLFFGVSFGRGISFETSRGSNRSCFYVENLATRPLQSCSPLVFVSTVSTFGRVGPPRPECGLPACEGHAQPFRLGCWCFQNGWCSTAKGESQRRCQDVLFSVLALKFCFLLVFLTVYLFNFQTL